MKTFRTVVVMLVLVLAGVLAAQWMAGTDRDLGEVFIRFAGYDLHTNVPRAVLALLLAGGVAWLLWRVLTLPFRAWGRHRRKQARASKDFATSDAIRDDLTASGVEVMDGDPLGWEWKLGD